MNNTGWKVTNLDLASIIGLIACAVIVMLVFCMGSRGLFETSMTTFVLITLGEAICCVLIIAPSLKSL